MLHDLRTRFRTHGQFTFAQHHSLRSMIRLHQVPNLPGIYLIFQGKSGDGDPIYVGKSGTISQDGSWSQQGLAERLCAKHNKSTMREQFFKQEMAKNNWASLSIAWFVTHDRDKGILPGLIEADLLNGFYQKYGQLPIWNKAF